MKKMEELKSMLCDELEQIAKKGSLSNSDLEKLHMESDTLKNLYKIEMMEDSGYSRADDYDRGSSNRRYSRDGGYSRDGYSRDGYSRDGGGYSGHDDKSRKSLERMYDEATSQRERDIIRRIMDAQ